MPLKLTEEETFVLLNLLTETIEAARYPLSPRIQTLRHLLSKFGPMGSAPPAAVAAGTQRG
jgi:thiamine pyrophosphate-dependent acetolactate synthase large subunit-like protein